MTAFLLRAPLRLPAMSASVGVSGSLDIAAGVATAMTLTGPSAGTTGVASSNFTVGLNGTAPGGLVITPDDAGAGGTFTPTTLSGAGTFTYTAASDGAKSIGITDNAGLTDPTDVAFTASASTFAWLITDNAQFDSIADSSLPIAMGVTTETYYASPDLLPGQTLSETGGVLSIVSDADLPTVNGDDSGSPIDEISARDIIIEVMAPELAICNHIRGGSTIATYGYGQATSIPTGIYSNQVSGDIFEISPGAIAATQSDSIGLDGDSGYINVTSSITLRNMTGRGRWKLLPTGEDTTYGSAHGILIHRPGACAGGERVAVVVQGCDLDSYGDCAVRLRSDTSIDGSYAPYVSSLTMSNFKCGRRTGARNSVISGAAETITMEDGQLFDGGSGSGQEHNAYISARTMVLRGVRFSRTRGWVGTPFSYTGEYVTLEGHMLKASAVTGTIEACVFDSVPLGDYSHAVQMKAGGNWTIRGTLFIEAQATNTARGVVNMCREYAGDGVTPNFAWWAGVEGNSLVFERNVIIGHVPRPIIGMFSQASVNAMRPASGGSWIAEERLDSMTIQDNIAMVTATPVYGSLGSEWLSGFPGTSNAMWINEDPNAGADWETRGNTAMTYDSGEAGFDNRALLLYTRTAGTIAASGSLATKRFVWPHGYIDRTDSYRGLA